MQILINPKWINANVIIHMCVAGGCAIQICDDVCECADISYYDILNMWTCLYTSMCYQNVMSSLQLVTFGS